MSCLEGSSSGANPSGELPLLYLRSKKPRCGDNLFQQQAGMASGSGNVAKKHCRNVSWRTEGEHHHSKNLVAERNRRTKIKAAQYALRALVPKITKMDVASIVGDAVEYILELQKEVKELQDELREIEEEEDFTKNKADVKTSASDMKKEGSIFLISTEDKQASSSFVRKSPAEVLVEVNHIGITNCLIKLFCEHNRGGFTRLMENMDSLGLQVVDANVTTFDGNVLVILEVEAKKLRDKLIQLAGGITDFGE